MQLLLQEFDDVFATPPGLPLLRSHNHCIHLLPEMEPLVVQPYQYPQLVKDELEHQCHDMLQQGIIQPSSSAFSSPVLLVKKQDGSWRFCVDYRALNTKTVQDMFPILVVDELLDELRGTKFFTKLDLRSGYHQVRMVTDDVEKTTFHTPQPLQDTGDAVRAHKRADDIPGLTERGTVGLHVGICARLLRQHPRLQSFMG
jgi:hypothetical protein